LSKAAYAKKIDSAVFPGLQGGPHMNNIAGAAITFKKAAEPAFVDYAQATLRNAKALAAALLAEGVTLITGGTDNHLLVIDTVASFGLDGRSAEEALDHIAVTTNKQIIPDDPRPPLRPSGLRLGTPACTTRGMNKEEMARIAQWIVRTLRHPEDAAVVEATRGEVEAMCQDYPVPGIS
jgi:glycine hydroxymethyltransferase